MLITVLVYALTTLVDELNNEYTWTVLQSTRKVKMREADRVDPYKDVLFFTSMGVQDAFQKYPE